MKAKFTAFSVEKIVHVKICVLVIPVFVMWYEHFPNGIKRQSFQPSLNQLFLRIMISMEEQIDRSGSCDCNCKRYKEKNYHVSKIIQFQSTKTS